MKFYIKYFLFASLVFFCGGISRNAFAGMPQKINVQGQIMDSQGNPLTGTQRITFTLYDEKSEGNEIVSFGEKEIKLSEWGLYRTDLDMNEVENFNQSMWLGVKIGDEDVLDKRIELLPSISSLYADRAGSVEWQNVENVSESDPTWRGAADVEDDISRNGNVGIGTENPRVPLEIAYNDSISSGEGTLLVGRRGGRASIKSSGEQDGHLVLDSHGDGGAYLNNYSTGKVVLAYGGGNVGIGKIPDDSYRLDVDGDIYTSGELTEGSDIALKENIGDLGYGLDEVMNIQSREFNMKKSGERDIGFIAQELEKIIPEVVSGEEGKKGVSYSKLTAVLVNALQEQQKTILNQEKRIELLESQLNND